MQIKKTKAVSNDEELTKLEATLDATNTEEQIVDKVEPTTESDSAPAKPNLVTEEPVVETSTTDEELTDDELSKVSDRAQRRIRELVAKVKALENSRPEPVVDMGSVEPKGDDMKLPWELPKADGDYEAYLREVARTTAKETFNESWKMNKEAERNVRIMDSLSKDIELVRSRYPELNETSPQYNAELTTRVANWYKPQFEKFKSEGKYARFDAFVDDLMSLRSQGVERGRQEVQSRVAKQAAEQTLPTSTGVEAKEVSVEDLIKGAKNIRELEAYEKQIRG